MTRPDRPHNPNRVAVNCADKITPNGNNVMLAEIGFTSYFMPAVFTWCKFHHKAHTFTLTQMLKSFHELSTISSQARENYIAILKQALSDVQADDEEKKEEIE